MGLGLPSPSHPLLFSTDTSHSLLQFSNSMGGDDLTVVCLSVGLSMSNTGVSVFVSYCEVVNE